MSWTRRWARTGLVGALVGLLVASGAAGADPREVRAREWQPPRTALAAVDARDVWATYGYQDDSGLCIVCEFRGGRYPYENWSKPDRYVTGLDAQGRLVVAQDRFDRLVLRTYASERRAPTSRTTVSYPRSWSYGGFYFAPDGFRYLLLGRSNYREDDTRAVLQVRRYDAAMTLSGTAVLRGRAARTYQPLVASAPSFALAGTKLLVYLAQEGYAGSDGLHHQWSFGFTVDTTTMTARVGGGGASHSFAQFVRVADGAAAFVDHGDAYPRAVGMTVDGELLDAGSTAEVSSYRLFRFRGRVGDNWTGSTVNGFEVGAGRGLVVGLSVPHGRVVKGVTGRSVRYLPNAYLISTDLATGGQRFRWLTTYSPKRTGVIVGQPRIVPVAGDRFVVLHNLSSGRRDPNTDYYKRNNRMRYVLVDALGRTLAARTFDNTHLVPLSQPVVRGQRMLWVGLFRNAGDPPRGGTYLTGLDITVLRSPTRLLR